MAETRKRRSPPRTPRKPAFQWGSVELPKEPALRVTGALVSVAVVLSILAYLAGQQLTDAQIKGAERVLSSLNAEKTVLEEKWKDGDVPAALLNAEEEHIDEEASQQSQELSQLKHESANG
jgi:hypothetical protein